MAYVAPVEESLFFIENCTSIPRLCAAGAFPLGDGDAAAILTAAGQFAAEVLAPIDDALDRVGAQFADGVVTMSPGHRDAYRGYAEGGWAGLTLAEEWGGQALPVTLNVACLEYWHAASMGFAMGNLLCTGAAETIEAFAPPELKAIYLPKLAAGEWMATMALTEPSAGSDLADIRTRAEPMGEGRYRIRGSKIFISYGEHDLVPNIVHLVLARLPDAPPGTRGISLFLVPKVLPDGECNDVRCTMIEHKMGMNGSPTCTMSFGDGEGAIGWMLGEPNKGLAAMFTMMNNARLAVGCQGVGAGDAAWQKAALYAAERRQGRPAGSTPNAVLPIARHPDVASMLLTMRALTTSARFLTLATGDAIDRSRHEADPAMSQAAKAEADLLTPVAKAFGTETGCEVASLAIQVHGGMGYVDESGVSRHYRDVRITTIYEGTNGVQAIDLVSRKLAADQGETARRMFARWRDAAEALDSADLDRTSANLKQALDVLERATGALLALAPADALAGASAYLRAFGLVGGAGLMAEAVAKANSAAPLGQTLRASLRFHAERLLPEVDALAAVVEHGAEALTASEAALEPRQ